MTAVAWILVFTTLGAWGAVLVLGRAALIRPYIRFLTVVTAAAVIGAIGGTALVPLAISVIIDAPIDQPWSTVLLVSGVLALELPGPAFLIAYLLGWLGEDHA